MEIEILEERENPLLGRKEVRFIVSFDGPMVKRGEVRDKLVALLNAQPDLLVVDHLKVEYGRPRAVGYAKVYSDEGLMNKIEREHILKRNFEEKKEEEEQ